MKLLQIALTTACNLACPTCPMKEHRTKDHPEYGLTNVRLCAYLYKYVDPKEWFIELTGGEPALYPGLDELLLWLQNHQYRGLIKTNGMRKIEKFGHFPRIAAWHLGLDKFPLFYDQILLVHGLPQFQEKAEYCRANNIPYQMIGLNKDHIDNTSHGIERVSFINAIGQVLECPAGIPEPKQTQYGDASMVDFAEPKGHDACQKCKAIIDFWRFIEPNWKEM